MDMKFVKPAPGLKIPMPERQMKILPAEGQEVPLDAFWLKRLADGDVVEASAAPAAKPAKPAKTKEPS